jgi:hypothetical protein
MAASLIPGSSSSSERRQFLRVAMGERADVVGLRLVPGRGATVRDLSHGGACIEVAARLLPGTPVDLQVTALGRRWLGRARVLRCHVSALVPDAGVRYEAALQFDLSRDPEGPDQLLTAVLAAVGRVYQVPNDLPRLMPARAVTTLGSVGEI